MQKRRKKKSQTHFEEVPIEVVRKILEQENASSEEGGKDVIVESSVKKTEPCTLPLPTAE
jgi:hypothetical protein